MHMISISFLFPTKNVMNKTSYNIFNVCFNLKHVMITFVNAVLTRARKRRNLYLKCITDRPSLTSNLSHTSLKRITYKKVT